MTSQPPRNYTGIGSRETPGDVLSTMRTIAARLAHLGYRLRSGGAKGADTAFDQGARSASGLVVRYLPWDGFRGYWHDTPGNIYVQHRATWKQAEAIAARIHPNWSSCMTGVRSLHTRNIFQVVGATLDTPSSFVVYWAPERNGEPQGGTRTAVLYARELGIPTFNLLYGSASFDAYLQDIAQ